LGAQQNTIQAAGGMIMAHYTQNMGGLNITDSPLSIGAEQATGGYNYEYAKTGGFKKSNAPLVLNAIADAQVRSRGFSLYYTKANAKTMLRYATTGVQSINQVTGATSLLTSDDSSPVNTFFDASSTKQAFGSMFTTPNTDIMWIAGGGVTRPIGAYSASDVTLNGVDAPTGAILAPVSLTGGAWVATGTYFYSVAYRKASTQALSNATLDVSATIVNSTDKATIDLTGLTNLDNVKYDKVFLYRSSVSGVTGFTAGVLVAQIDSTTTSYVDTGTSLTVSEVVPRVGNTLLDNSPLPAGTFDTICIWKRRLVTASDSTLYLSDINKPESWPLSNSFNIASGGKITAVVVIGYNHPGGSTIDEFLAVFKEDECWVITGDDPDTWNLQFIDYTGCIQQGLLASANGFIYWIDRRGAYVWDGVGKPIYMSRPIEYNFQNEGDIDKSRLNLGVADFIRDQNQIIWFLSSNTLGEQKYILRLDLRLTLPSIKNMLGERIIDGVFMQGASTNPIYACSALQSDVVNEHKDYFFTGDNAGFIYKAFSITTGTGNDVAFSYTTAHLDQGRVGMTKRYNKVIAWVDTIGPYPLTLDYWTNYRVRDADKSTLTVNISGTALGAAALWDVAFWDVALWDDGLSTLTPVVFNLPPGAGGNNNEGDAIRLRFSNSVSGNPMTVNAFSILYTELGVRK